VYADTRDLMPGLHVVFLNVTATIGSQLVGETIQGYIVVTDRDVGCGP
jgi:hypothetical protein